MPNFIRRAGCVDPVSDCADHKSCHVGNEIFEAWIAHDSDAVARLDSERYQAKRKGFHFLAVFPPGHFLVKAEILVAKCNRVRAGSSTLEKQLRHALSIKRPGSVLVMSRNLVPIRIHDFGPPASRYNSVLANHSPDVRASQPHVASVQHHRRQGGARRESIRRTRGSLWRQPAAFTVASARTAFALSISVSLPREQASQKNLDLHIEKFVDIDNNAAQRTRME